MRLLFLSLFAFASQVFAAPWAVQKPKLVVVMVIDQFRADYISRFQQSFSQDGFLALIKNGAYFPYGEYDLLQSMTCPGHATVLTGAYPYQMGIPINEWYDQKLHKKVYCVDDSTAKLVGSSDPEGVSPRNLQGDTVGDELKNADGPPSKTIAIALKDRAAILLGGHRADLALWFDNEGKNWVTSDYYRKDLPEWMEKLNQNSRFKNCSAEMPCSAEMTVEAVSRAVSAEALGTHPGVDLLAISFSGHDFAGHKFGPNADEMKAMTLAEDKAIADLRKLVLSKVPGGAKNVLFVLTGDHGVASKPEYLAEHKIEAGRINEKALVKEMNEALDKKYGTPAKGGWISFVLDFNFYINEQAVQERKADLRAVEAEMKEILSRNPGMAFVVTKSEIENHQYPPGMFERKVAKTFFKGRSGHVIGIQRPFFINDAGKEANHMTGYAYDRTVPIVFSGFGIKNGLYTGHTEVVDIAPTLSMLLGLIPPALSEGRVLSEALK